jgi:Protein of unknown function (DUF3072)
MRRVMNKGRPICYSLFLIKGPVVGVIYTDRKIFLDSPGYLDNKPYRSVMSSSKSSKPHPSSTLKGGVENSNTEKDPAEWTSGDDPMTGAQASYLKTLSEEAGENFDPEISKAEASKRIDSLRKKTGKE